MSIGSRPTVERLGAMVLRVRGPVIAFVLTLLGFMWLSVLAGQRYDLFTLSYYFAAQGSRTPPAEVVVVPITNDTFKLLRHNPARPLPAAQLADIIERIVQFEPSALVIDAAIPADPTDITSASRIAKAMHSTFTVLGDGRQALGASSSGNPVVAALLNDEENVRNAAAINSKLPLLRNLGYVTTFTVQRETVLNSVDAASKNDSMRAAHILSALWGQQEAGRFERRFINFYGEPGTIKSASSVALLEREDEAQLGAELRGRIVVLGFASPNLQRGPALEDTYMTPVSTKTFYSPELLATIAANMFDGSAIRQPAAGLRGSLLALFFVLSAALAIFPRVRISVIANVILCVVTCVLPAYLLRKYLWVPGLTFLPVLCVLSLAISVCRYHTVLTTLKSRIRKIFRFDLDGGAALDRDL